MADLISKLAENLKPKPSATIGVSISQSGLMEVCVFDKTNNIVKKYANRHVRYNLQTREIDNLEEFSVNLLAMYQELDIPNNCNVVLSLPSVFFDLKSVPLILDLDATESVLLGEIEQSYVFKKIESSMAWLEVGASERKDNKVIAYAAVQKNVVNQFVDLFSGIGSKLIAIDNSYFNLLNTIPKTAIAKKEIETNAPWNIILVTYNSYVIFSMLGDKLLEYFEEPIALRSISSHEDIYSTLSDSINNSLQNYVANSILVISDSDDVDASVLSEKINFHGNKNYLNQNKYASGQIIETSPHILPDYISSISLYAIGSSIYKFVEENKVINLMSNIQDTVSKSSYTVTIGTLELELTKETIQAFTILVALIFGVLYGSIFFALHKINASNETKLANLETQMSNITNEIKTIKEASQEGENGKIFDLTTAKADIVEKNKQAILYYNLLSFNIPRSTWITRFYTNSLGAILIEGKTSSTNNVYLFFKGIKASLNDSDLALTKLKYAAGFEDEIAFTNRLLYEFELSNAAYSTSQPAADAQAQAQQPAPADAALNQAKQEIQQKVDSATSNINKEKAPDLPPIEDINVNKGESKPASPRTTQKLTKEDVKETQKAKEDKGTTNKTDTQNGSSPELPDLPDLGK